MLLYVIHDTYEFQFTDTDNSSQDHLPFQKYVHICIHIHICIYIYRYDVICMLFSHNGSS